MDARVHEYARARITHNERSLHTLESYITGLMVEASTPSEILREVLLACLSDTCELSTKFPESEAEYLVVLGLRNPNCPPEVLSSACCHGNLRYRRISAQHPNCPEEDAVQVVLSDDVHLPTMVVMRHTHTSFTSDVTSSGWWGDV